MFADTLCPRCMNVSILHVIVIIVQKLYPYLQCLTHAQARMGKAAVIPGTRDGAGVL